MFIINTEQMELSALFILYISINILAFLAGNIVETFKMPKWLDFKPFNCRLCMSTHTAWVLQSLVAIITGSWTYFIAGVAGAGVIYHLIKEEDNSQFE